MSVDVEYWIAEIYGYLYQYETQAIRNINKRVFIILSSVIIRFECASTFTISCNYESDVPSISSRTRTNMIFIFIFLMVDINFLYNIIKGILSNCVYEVAGLKFNCFQMKASTLRILGQAFLYCAIVFKATLENNNTEKYLLRSFYYRLANIKRIGSKITCWLSI